jgi:hypothetical protein
MAWVLGHGRRALEEAEASGRAPAWARARNAVTAIKRLRGLSHKYAHVWIGVQARTYLRDRPLSAQATLRAESAQPLGLDADAAAVVDQLAREGPPSHVLREIALSAPTTRCASSPGLHEDRDG